MNPTTALAERPSPARRSGRLAKHAPTAATTPQGSLAAQFRRYLVGGGLGFLVDFGCLYGLTEWLGMHYLQSAAVAFTAGMAMNYALSIAWVFDRRTVADARLEFALFALVGIVGLGLNEVIIWGLTSGAGVAYLASKLVSTSIVLGWNFSARKALLFR